MYICKFLLQSKFRSDTDLEAKAETDSQCAQLHEMKFYQQDVLSERSQVSKCFINVKVSL